MTKATHVPIYIQIFRSPSHCRKSEIFVQKLKIRIRLNIFVPNLSIFKTKLKPKFKSKKRNFEPKIVFYHSVPLMQRSISHFMGGSAFIES